MREPVVFPSTVAFLIGVGLIFATVAMPMMIISNTSDSHMSKVNVVEDTEREEVIITIDELREDYISLPIDNVVDAGDCEIRGEECWLFAEGDTVTIDVSDDYGFDVVSAEDGHTETIKEV